VPPCCPSSRHAGHHPQSGTRREPDACRSWASGLDEPSEELFRQVREAAHPAALPPRRLAGPHVVVTHLAGVSGVLEHRTLRSRRLPAVPTLVAVVARTGGRDASGSALGALAASVARHCLGHERAAPSGLPPRTPASRMTVMGTSPARKGRIVPPHQAFTGRRGESGVVTPLANVTSSKDVASGVRSKRGTLISWSARQGPWRALGGHLPQGTRLASQTRGRGSGSRRPRRAGHSGEGRVRFVRQRAGWRASVHP
jgi:hypothetical protein